MIDDRNKTEITKLVTAAAYRYLDERGFKPVETEVPVADGWVADLAGVILPTQTELQELKLLPRKPSWKQPHADREAWYSLARQAQQLMTALVEVKTSRSDFRGDKKWTAIPPTNLAYIAIPNDLAIRPEEIPDGWGVLLYSSASDCLRISRPPTLRQVSTEVQLDTVHEIALRRDHHTRYAKLRELQREGRLHEGEEVTRQRIGKCMAAVLAVFDGCSWGGKFPHESMEAALEFHGIKNMTGWELEHLQKLWRRGANTPDHPTPTLTAGRDPEPVLCEEERRKEKA